MQNTVTYLKFGLLLCVVILAYYLRRYLRLKLDKRYKNIISNISHKKISELIQFKKAEDYKGKIFKHIQDGLVKCGNPLNLTPLSYLLIKFIAPLIALILAMSAYAKEDKTLGIIVSIAISVFTFFVIDIVNNMSNNDDKNKIRLDLADAYDLINIQTVAGVSLGYALTEAYTVCKCKRFKSSLIRLAAKINLSKNIEKSLDEFNEEYDLPEINTFVSVMKESLESGISEETLDDLSVSLKTVNAIYTEKKTQKVDAYMLVISMLLLFGVMGVIYFAMISMFGGSLISIFR